MSYSVPIVTYSTSLQGTYTQLTGVQNVTISRGRQRFTDNFPASSCTIELIPATSYATPLAIGQYLDVRVTTSGTSRAYFTGRITDIQRRYEMPYNSSTGYAPADRITITATGGTGTLAATQTLNFPIGNSANRVVEENIGNIATNVNVFRSWVTYQPSVFVKQLTTPVSGGSLDIVNKLLRTGQMVIDDLDLNRTVLFSNQNTGIRVWYSDEFVELPSEPVFTDVKPVTTQLPFTAIEFLSGAQENYTQVVVEADELADQNATTGLAPYNALTYTTFSESTTEAASLAGYLVSMLSGQVTAAPFMLQTDTYVAPLCVEQLYVPRAQFAETSLIGTSAAIQFRGTNYKAIVQGFNCSFSLNRAIATFFLSPSLGQPFILDSTAYGKLDVNRLGFP